MDFISNLLISIIIILSQLIILLLSIIPTEIVFKKKFGK